MYIRIISVIFISHFWTICFSQGLTDKPKDVSVPYKTINLKNSYSLIYGETPAKRNLRLVGPGVDTLIHVRDIRASDKYLGILRADFDNYFVLYLGDGDLFVGVEVYEKRSGRIVIKGMGMEIDTSKGIIYYLDTNNNRELGIFDIATGKKELFKPPDVPCLWWFECLYSKTLTDRELIIEYAGWNNTRQRKVYIR